MAMFSQVPMSKPWKTRPNPPRPSSLPTASMNVRSGPQGSLQRVSERMSPCLMGKESCDQHCWDVIIKNGTFLDMIDFSLPCFISDVAGAMGLLGNLLGPRIPSSATLGLHKGRQWDMVWTKKHGLSKRCRIGRFTLCRRTKNCGSILKWGFECEGSDCFAKDKGDESDRMKIRETPSFPRH